MVIIHGKLRNQHTDSVQLYASVLRYVNNNTFAFKYFYLLSNHLCTFVGNLCTWVDICALFRTKMMDFCLDLVFVTCAFIITLLFVKICNITLFSHRNFNPPIPGTQFLQTDQKIPLEANRRSSLKPNIESPEITVIG